MHCQVEYSYPPLTPNGAVDSNECPPGWKYLPTLALPDGSHNYDKDTVFFHLPGLNGPNETVFGISCFRQIPVEVCHIYFYQSSRDLFLKFLDSILVIVQELCGKLESGLQTKTKVEKCYAGLKTAIQLIFWFIVVRFMF